MYKLVSVLYSLPAHTCDVERGFSTRRLLKDRLRNKIQVQTMDALMRVKLSAIYPTTFDLTESFKVYKPTGAKLS